MDGIHEVDSVPITADAHCKQKDIKTSDRSNAVADAAHKTQTHVESYREMTSVRTEVVTLGTVPPAGTGSDSGLDDTGREAPSNQNSLSPNSQTISDTGCCDIDAEPFEPQAPPTERNHHIEQTSEITRPAQTQPVAVESTQKKDIVSLSHDIIASSRTPTATGAGAKPVVVGAKTVAIGAKLAPKNGAGATANGGGLLVRKNDAVVNFVKAGKDFTAEVIPPKKWTFQEKYEQSAEQLSICVRMGHQSKRILPENQPRSFGFTLRGGADKSLPLTVDAVILGSPADNSDLLVGDEIISINGSDTSNLHLVTANRTVSECLNLGQIELVVRRYRLAGAVQNGTGNGAKNDRVPPPQLPRRSTLSPTVDTQSSSIISPNNSLNPKETFEQRRSLFDQRAQETTAQLPYSEWAKQRHGKQRHGNSHWSAPPMRNPGAGVNLAQGRANTLVACEPRHARDTSADTHTSNASGKLVDEPSRCSSEQSDRSRSPRLPEGKQANSCFMAPTMPVGCDYRVGRLSDFVPESERGSLTGCSSKTPSDFGSRSHLSTGGEGTAQQNGPQRPGSPMSSSLSVVSDGLEQNEQNESSRCPSVASSEFSTHKSSTKGEEIPLKAPTKSMRQEVLKAALAPNGANAMENGVHEECFDLENECQEMDEVEKMKPRRRRLSAGKLLRLGVQRVRATFIKSHDTASLERIDNRARSAIGVAPAPIDANTNDDHLSAIGVRDERVAHQQRFVYYHNGGAMVSGASRPASVMSHSSRFGATSSASTAAPMPGKGAGGGVRETDLDEDLMMARRNERSQFFPAESRDWRQRQHRDKTPTRLQPVYAPQYYHNSVNQNGYHNPVNQNGYHNPVNQNGYHNPVNQNGYHNNQVYNHYGQHGNANGWRYVQRQYSVNSTSAPNRQQAVRQRHELIREQAKPSGPGVNANANANGTSILKPIEQTRPYAHVKKHIVFAHEPIPGGGERLGPLPPANPNTSGSSHTSSSLSPQSVDSCASSTNGANASATVPTPVQQHGAMAPVPQQRQTEPQSQIASTAASSRLTQQLHVAAVVHERVTSSKSPNSAIAAEFGGPIAASTHSNNNNRHRRDTPPPYDVAVQQQHQQQVGKRPSAAPQVGGDGVGEEPVLSVSGRQKCSHCQTELGRGAAMIIESLGLFYHLACFRCHVCGCSLGSGHTGADVRIRRDRLHCKLCYSSDDAGWKYSEV